MILVILTGALRKGERGGERKGRKKKRWKEEREKEKGTKDKGQRRKGIEERRNKLVIKMNPIPGIQHRPYIHTNKPYTHTYSDTSHNSKDSTNTHIQVPVYNTHSTLIRKVFRYKNLKSLLYYFTSILQLLVLYSISDRSCSSSLPDITCVLYMYNDIREGALHS